MNTGGRFAQVVRVLCAVAFAVGVAAAAHAGPMRDSVHGGGAQGNPGVAPPNASPYGMSYGQWSAAWWQWAFSLPVADNPLFDETGCVHGANGQSGPVWFLGGVFNVSGSASRTCSVPAGKALFFPILNVECSTVEGNGTTDAALRACAKGTMDGATSVFCELDGTPMENLQAYRVQSPLFTFGPLPDGNILQFFGVDAPEGTTSPSVADGVYLMLTPPSAGPHTLHFGGEFFGFAIDITYQLIVGDGSAAAIDGNTGESSSSTVASFHRAVTWPWLMRGATMGPGAAPAQPARVLPTTWGQLKSIYR